MSRTITVDFAHIDEGEIEIPGLGLFANGEHEVTDDQEATYEALGFEWPEGDRWGDAPLVEEEATPVEENPEPPAEVVTEQTQEATDDDEEEDQ